MRKKAVFERGNRKNKRNGIKRAVSLMLCTMMLLSGMPGTAFAKAKTLPYERIESFSDGLAMVCRNGKWGFVDKTGKEVVKTKYTAVRSFSEGLAAVRRSGKWGFVDKNGKEVVKPKYMAAGAFSEGLAKVQQGALWGFVDKNGKEAVKPKYTRAWSFMDGLARVCATSGGNWNYGYINKTGKEVVEPKYDYAEFFSEGLAAVTLNRKLGFVDKAGKVAIPLKYYGLNERGIHFSEGLAAVREDRTEGNTILGKYGYIDKNGTAVTEFQYDQAGAFVGGTALVGGMNSQIIDQTGRVVAEQTYQNPFGSSSNNLIRVEKRDYTTSPYRSYYGFIDRNGNEVVELKYDFTTDFSNGYACVCLDGKWGFVDETGREVLAPEYDEIYAFSDGLAEVRLNGKSGFVDETGKEVIAPKYEEAWAFSDGLARAVQNGKTLVINKSGEVVFELKYKGKQDK